MTISLARSMLQGGTALGRDRGLTARRFSLRKAWAQGAPWKPEKGAKLTVMRWKRFVQAEDEAFNAMVAAFKAATGTDMNVFSESFEDVQPKASVAANTGSGLDLAWGLHTLPQLFPTKVIQLNDVADYLGKKYGGWTDAAAAPASRATTGCIPVASMGDYLNYRNSSCKGRASRIPQDFRLPGSAQSTQGRTTRRPASRSTNFPATPTPGSIGSCGGTMASQWTRTTRSPSIRQGPSRPWNKPQGAVGHFHLPRRLLERLTPTTRRSSLASSTSPQQRHLDLRRRQGRSDQERIAEDMDSRMYPVGLVSSRRNYNSTCRSWRTSFKTERRKGLHSSCWRRRTSIHGCLARTAIRRKPQRPRFLPGLDPPIRRTSV